MNKKNMYSSLVTICSKLTMIRQLMSLLGLMPDPETVRETLTKRQIILEDISKEIIILDHIDINWREKISEDPELISLGKKFKALAESTAELDNEIISGFKKRMCDIEGKLKDLASSSKAAFSYAAHSAF